MKKFLPFVLIIVLLLSGCTSKKPDDIDDEEEIEESDDDNEDDESSSKKKKKGTAELSFSSFDGSGTSFDVIIDDPNIVKYDSETKYRKKDHKKLKGARYDKIFTFEGLKEGETTITIIKESGCDDEFERYYDVTVDKDLKVKMVEIKKEPEVDPEPDYLGMMEPMAIVFIRFNDETITVYMSDNQTADDFTYALSHESYPPELEFHDDGDIITADLPWSILTDNEDQTCNPGDIVLLDGNRIAIVCYETELNATRIGNLNYIPQEDDEIKELFGDGDIKIEFNVEFTE